MKILPLHHDYQIQIPIQDIKRIRANYHASAAWTVMSDKILERDKVCRKCSYNGIKKEIHHIRYKSFRDCTEDDLILLCSSCHNHWHKIQEPTPWTEWISTPFPAPWNGVRKKDRGRRPEQRKRYFLKYPEKAKEKARIQNWVKQERCKLMSLFKDEIKSMAETKGLSWPTQSKARKALGLAVEKGPHPEDEPSQ